MRFARARDHPPGLSQAALFLSCVALVLLAACSEDSLTAIGPRPHFDTIDFPDAAGTVAFGVNSTGGVVGNNRDAEGKTHGFLLQDGAFTRVDVPGATFSSAVGINDSGDIVGRYISADNVSHGYRLSAGNFSTIDFPGSSWTNAPGINAAGDVVGWYIDSANHIRGYLLKHGAFSSVDFRGLEGTFPFGIGRADEIVGVTEASGFFMSGATADVIEYPGAVFTTARGVAPDGAIVGYFATADSLRHGYLLERGDFHAFDIPGAVNTFVHGISSDGRVTGTFTDVNGVDHGFVTTREDALRLGSGSSDDGSGDAKPVVSRADPSVLPLAATLDVRIIGSGFDDRSHVELRRAGSAVPQVHTESVRFVGPEELVATIAISPDAAPGLYDVLVEDRKGKQGIGTELIDVDSLAMSGTWDLTARLHLATEDCVANGPLDLSQNGHALQGSIVLGFVCAHGAFGPILLSVSGVVAQNGRDFSIDVGDPACEFRGTHDGGTAYGGVGPCESLGPINESSPFTGTWQAERR
jgi:probable HAF family extracellular repeat protein